MFLCEQIVFFVAMMFVTVIFGASTLKMLHYKVSITNTLVLGFLSLCAVSFVIFSVLRLLDIPFVNSFYIFVSLMLILILISIVLIVKNGMIKEYFIQAKSCCRTIWNGKFVYLGLLVLVIAMIYICCCCYIPISDDSYYLPRSMEMINTNSLNVTECFAWLGYNADSYPNSFDISTLEIVRAVIAYAFNVPVTVISRCSLSIYLIVIAFCSSWQLTGSVFKGEQSVKKQQITMYIYYFILVIASCSYYIDSMPFWQVFYTWTGKAILISVVFPYIMKLFFDICNSPKDVSWNYFITLDIVLIAGVSATIVGVIFPVLFSFVLGMPHLIYRMVKKELNIKILLQFAVAVIPCVICAVISLVIITVVGNSVYKAEDFVPVWSNIFKSMMSVGNWIYFIVYALSVIYVLLNGTKTQKLIFVCSPIFLFLTLLNPALTAIVAKNITTGTVYWRLYWLLPMWFVPAVASSNIICDFCDSYLKKKMVDNKIVKISLIFVMAFVGVFTIRFARKAMFTYPRNTNNYGITEFTKQAADYMTDNNSKKAVLYDLDKSLYEIRQYSTNVILISGIRNYQEQYVGIKDIVNISGKILDNQKITDQDFAELYTSNSVDYYAITKKNESLIADCQGLVKDKEFEDVCLYIHAS